MPKTHHFKTGDEFGDLTIMGPAPRDHTAHNNWRCLCKCGNEYIGRAAKLADGTTWRCKRCATAASAAGRLAGREAKRDPLATILLKVYTVAASNIGTPAMKEILDLCHAGLSRK